IPKFGYQVVRNGAQLAFASDTNPETAHPMELALGSGKIGVTFVSPLADDSLLEMRLSYFPSRRLWYPTPGQREGLDDRAGEVYHSQIARRCLLCHSTTLPDHRLKPERKFYGVGCEACHGPGSEHVRSARAGQLSDLHIETFHARS